MNQYFHSLTKSRHAGVTGIIFAFGFITATIVFTTTELLILRGFHRISLFPVWNSTAANCGPNPSVQAAKTVPNPFYLHYIRFKPEDGTYSLKFTDYLSVMSAVQYLKPDGIILHGDSEPEGEYWQRLKSKGFIRHNYRKKNTNAGQFKGQPQTVGFIEHAADIAKLDVLLEYGGLAVDFDVFFVRGQRVREILSRKKALLCFGDADGYNIGFVGAQKDSKLLYAWRRSYEDIYINDWGFNQARVSKYLAVLFREEIYVADRICNNPHWDNREDYFHRHGVLNWTDSIAIHSYERHGGVSISSPLDLSGPLTSHKELLITIFRNLTLPPENLSLKEEIDPLTSKLIL